MYVFVYVYSKYSNIYSKITVLCLFLEVDSTRGFTSWSAEAQQGLSQRFCTRGDELGELWLLLQVKAVSVQ